MSKYIEKVVSLAKENPGAELEIRLKNNITKEIFDSVAVEAQKKYGEGTIEMSVRIISTKVYGRNDKASSIQQITYGDGPARVEYFKKERLMQPIMIPDYIKYFVGISTETPINPFPSSNNSLLRFKLRLSVDLSADWRLDMTAVCSGQFSELKNDLKNIRNDLFSQKITPRTFTSANHSCISSYEIEIEYIGKEPPSVESFNIVQEVFTLFNPNYVSEINYQNEIYRIAKEIHPRPEMFKKHRHRLKQLTNQVVSLQLQSYVTEIYPPMGYFVTEKLDGQRCVISLRDKLRVLKSDGMEEYEVHSTDDDDLVPLIVDTERIGNEFWIFDVMTFETNISKRGFADRMQYIEKVATYLNSLSFVDDSPKTRNVATRTVSAESSTMSNAKTKIVDNVAEKDSKTAPTVPATKLTFHAKSYVVIQDLKRDFEEVYHRDHHTIDGLIITAPGSPYIETPNYKWKPLEMTTIDFLSVRCPDSLLGALPYKVVPGMTLYLLFVGVSPAMKENLGLGLIHNYRSIFPQTQKDYFPIQFSPSQNPLAYLFYSTEDIDRKIVELSISDAIPPGLPTGVLPWKFHRVREDRKMEKNYFGNDFRIAELTYQNFINPFEFKNLYERPVTYFHKQSPEQYVASNKLKRFVISVVMKEEFHGAKWMIDVGSGRGADLHRYNDIKVQNALFIDIDAAAIAELIHRKFSLQKRRHNSSWTGGDMVITRTNQITDIEYDKIITKDTAALTVHTMVADMKTAAGVLIQRSRVYGVNPKAITGMISNFALHYLCDTAANLKNFMVYARDLLQPGGLLMVTVMSGERVEKLLTDNNIPVGGTWQLMENERQKYAIRRIYKVKSKYNQRIAVKLPFTDEMYEEPLCHIENLIAVAKQHKLEVERNNSFSEWLPMFKKIDRGLYDRLTPADIEFIGLHQLVTLRTTT